MVNWNMADKSTGQQILRSTGTQPFLNIHNNATTFPLSSAVKNINDKNCSNYTKPVKGLNC